MKKTKDTLIEIGIEDFLIAERKLFQCVHDHSEARCKNCAFNNNKELCDKYACNREERKDHEMVSFRPCKRDECYGRYVKADGHLLKRIEVESGCTDCYFYKKLSACEPVACIGALHTLLDDELYCYVLDE